MKRNQHTDKPACVHGHPLSGANVKVSGGQRRCLTCADEAHARFRATHRRVRVGERGGERRKWVRR